VVKTDHAALLFLRKFADLNSRLLRWSIRLSEMDYVVQHRPAAKIAHVDALSRHVGTVTLSQPGIRWLTAVAMQTGLRVGKFLSPWTANGYRTGDWSVSL
jgi:hypothetical protein